MRNWWRRVIAWVLVVAAIVIDPGPVAAAPTCTTSGNGYEVTVCLVAPVDGSRLTATTRISIRVERTRGAPGLRFVNAYLDGEYLLQDAHHPYQFELPTQFFADGAHRLEIAATLRDGFQSERAALDLVFDNGNSVAPGPGRRFSPRGRDQLGDGPLLLAAVGDGASGSQASKDVVALIDGWNPDLFAYLGDVYQEGTPVEFYNWYGHGGTFFDRFHSITNPTVGNHEYDGGVAAGYRHYWGDPPLFYSFDADQWHVVVLNSATTVDASVGTEQYRWLVDDLATSESSCAIAYFHHPVLSEGQHGDRPLLNDIWRVLADEGVDVVLTGHEHHYQRWAALDENFARDPNGVTQFVVGTGGRDIRGLTRSDPRVERAIDDPGAFGALRLELDDGEARFSFVTTSGVTLDSGRVPCDDGEVVGRGARIADARTIDELVRAEDYRPAEHGEILRLYRAIFDREPDVDGARYWIGEVFEGQGRSVAEITSFIATDDQPEFRAAYAEVSSNRAFVERIYRNMLGREPEPAGLRYWVDQMRRGLGRADTARFVALSPEFIARYPYRP